MVRQVFRDTFRATREFSRNARLFLLATFFSWAGFAANHVLFNLYLTEGGFGEEFAGNSAALVALGMGLAALPAGLLSDKIGRRKTLLLGGVGLGLSLLIRCLTFSAPLLLITSFTTGAFQALGVITASPFLSENSRSRIRTQLFSANFAAMLVAGIVGNLGGGQLPELLSRIVPFSGETLLLPYRWTLIIGAIASFSSIWPILFIRDRILSHDDPISPEAARESTKTLAKLFLNFLFIGFGAGLIMPFFNLYFANRFQCTSGQIGLFFAMSQVLTIFAALAGPRLARQFGLLKTITWLQLISLPFLVTLGFEEHLWLAVLAFLARASLMQTSSPLHNAFSMEIVPPSLRARTAGLNMAAWFLGWAVSANAAGWIMANIGYEYPYYMTAFFYFLASISLYWMFRGHAKRNVGRVGG